jgi:hypothetical protein
MMMKRDERLTGHKRGQTVRLVQHAVLACPLNIMNLSRTLLRRPVSRRAAYG